MKRAPNNFGPGSDGDDEFEQVLRPSDPSEAPPLARSVTAGGIKPASRPKASAKAKALSFLARREHSRKELQSKLLQRGYLADEVAEAIDWAISHQFQSDERFSQSLIRRKAPTLGDRALDAELSQHGLSGMGKKASVLSDADRDSVDPDQEMGACQPESERAFDWLKRRYWSALVSVREADSADAASARFALKAKAMRALATRGFEFSNIQKAWKRLLSEFDSDA